MATRLTAKVKAGGCASKLSPSILDSALRNLPKRSSAQVLVGYDTSDDAGVFDLSQLSGRPLAMVQTVDFFTPIVDDPYTFGAIAAANALSDIYAMGGTPVTALSLLMYPAEGDMHDLGAIMAGGSDKLTEADAVLLGGHSISEDEIKFGYAVTGLIEPDRVLSNAGAQPGDVLLFTKRLGTGVISSALKKGIAKESDVETATAQMLTLNRKAAEAMRSHKVNACTDVTGFGLLGHAREVAMASNVTLQISLESLRFLPGALGYARAGTLSGGLHNNRGFVASCVAKNVEVAPEIEALLYDPQTSGGLLISLPEKDANSLQAEFSDAYRIGSVATPDGKPIRLV